LPLASSTNHLRLISLPLGMVVDIFGLLPDSAVFLVRRGAGRKWCQVGSS
jgi:hypothetical protein